MILLLAAATAASASPEAERLGRELASSGALETVLPAVAAKETDEVVAAHPELSAAERGMLRDTARIVAAGERERMIDVFGPLYASTLSLADLRALTAFNRTLAAHNYREAVLKVTLQGLTSIGRVDFKGDLAKAFCARSGKLCGGQ